MFKRIISREFGEPWPSTGMTSQKWLDVPLQEVRIKDLIATQNGIYFHALTKDHEYLGIDPYPHVVLWEGELYLEDGHHRVVKARIKGRKKIQARVLILPS